MLFYIRFSFIFSLTEATAWLEHAASLVGSPSSQGKGDMATVLEDCSHALQCVNTLSTIETSQVRLVSATKRSELATQPLASPVWNYEQLSEKDKTN